MRSLNCLPHALRGPSNIAHCTSGPEVHSASLEGRNGASRICHSRVSGLLGSILPWLLLSLKVCEQWTDASGIGIFYKSNSHLPDLHVIQFPCESMCVNARKSLLCKRPLPTAAPAPPTPLPTVLPSSDLSVQRTPLLRATLSPPSLTMLEE